MAVGPLTRKERQQQTRAAVIAAAAELFAERGVDGTSLEAVARHAGLTQGAIYSNFTSKAELWWAVAEAATRTIGIKRIFTGERSLADELSELGAEAARMAKGVARNEYLLDQEFHLFAQRHPDVRDQVARRIRADVEAFGVLLENNAHRRGEPLPMPGEHLALLIRALGRGLVFEAMFDAGVADEVAFANAFAQLAKP